MKLATPAQGSAIVSEVTLPKVGWRELVLGFYFAGIALDEKL
jgi:hypothetical protein